MLVGRSGVRACPRPFCRSLASYPPKVYAYPFAVSPAEAIQQLSPVVGGRSTFQSLFNSGSQKPKQIVPVYFPAWFIDAEVEATVTVSTDRGTEDGRVTAVFTNSYIPGHTWDKLSSMSLLSPQLADSKAVPFSSDMETQHGSKITCLPFQTSPFSVLDAVKSLRPADCVHGNLRLDPLSISTNLISAYPVLIPLYLAKYQYKVKDDDNTVPVSQTAVMEAHHMTGRIIVENIQLIQQMAPPEMIDEINEFITTYAASSGPGGWAFRRFMPRWMWDTDALMYHQGAQSNFGNISSLTLPPAWNGGGFQDIGSWLDTFMTAESLKKLVKTGGATMDDPRIRPLTEPELERVRKYIALGLESAKAHTLFDGISKVDGNGKSPQQLKDFAASFDAEREKATPSWWRDWQQQSTPQKAKQP